MLKYNRHMLAIILKNMLKKNQSTTLEYTLRSKTLIFPTFLLVNNIVPTFLVKQKEKTISQNPRQIRINQGGVPRRMSETNKKMSSSNNKTEGLFKKVVFRF